MTTPICCARCQHWKKHREQNCNWGVCNKITNAIASDLALVFIQPHPGGEQHASEYAELHTRDTFYCPMFQPKPTDQKTNIVAAVQEAARNFHKR